MGSEVSHCAANDGARCTNRCGQGDDVEWEFSPHGTRQDIDTVEVLSRDLKPLPATHGSPQKRQRPQEDSKVERKAEVIRSSSSYLEQKEVARSSSHYKDARGNMVTSNGAVPQNSNYLRAQSPPARPQPASQRVRQTSNYTVVSQLNSFLLTTQQKSNPKPAKQPQQPQSFEPIVRENPGSGRTEETEGRMNNLLRNEAKRHAPSCGSSAATTAPPSVGTAPTAPPSSAGSMRAPMAQQMAYAGNPGSFVQAAQLSPKPQGSYTAAAPPQLVSFVQGRPGQRPLSPVRARNSSPGRFIPPTAMRCNSMPTVQRKPMMENPPTDERRSWKAAAEDPARKPKPGDALSLERPRNSNLVSRQTTNNQVLKSSDFRKRLEGLEEAAKGLR